MFERNHWHIMKGDIVKVMVGRSSKAEVNPGPKGRIGTVTAVIRDKTNPRVMVENVSQVSPRTSWLQSAFCPHTLQLASFTWSHDDALHSAFTTV